MNVFPVQTNNFEQELFGKSVFAHHLNGGQSANIGELQLPVIEQPKKSVAFHSGHGLRNSWARVI
jgi:hypothetical protein